MTDSGKTNSTQPPVNEEEMHAQPADSAAVNKEPGHEQTVKGPLSAGATTAITFALIAIAALAVLGCFLYNHHRSAIERMNQSLEVEDFDWESAIYEETEPEVPETEIPFEPHSGADTVPENLISYTEILVNGELLQDQSAYQPWYHFDFSPKGDYTSMDGVITFRGNNLRNAPVYGKADFSKVLPTALHD